MTNEEYLRVCGWSRSRENEWTRSRGDGPTCDVYCPLTTAQAVEVQLAEDRARLAFVLERSHVRFPKAHDDGWTVEPKPT